MSAVNIQLSQEEIAHIMDRRQRNAEARAYNSALADAYNIVVTTFPMSETRGDVIAALQSLRKDMT